MRAARFADLRSAGRELAPLLAPYASSGRPLALAIVRGGMPVATEVAATLSLPIDVVLLRRLFFARGASEPSIAAWVAGTQVLPEGLADAMPDEAAVFLPDALAAFAERNLVCRADRRPVNVTGRTILLIDNGAHTGGTIRASVRAIRALGAARIIAALPVASPESRALLDDCADEVVCCAWPEPFGNVAMSYANFDVPQVEEIHAMLEAASRDR